MAVFKRAKCVCGFMKNEAQPGREAGNCPKCGQGMRYLDSWYISYQFMGKKYVEAVGSQKRMAEDALSKVKVNIREGRYFDKAPETPWREAVEQFRKWFSFNVKPHTIRMYENSIKNLTPYFERYSLDKITVPMVEQFKAKRSTENLAPATINRDLATLKRVFSLCEQWGFLEVNRIRKVQLFKEKNDRIRYLTPDEEKELLRQCTAPYLRLAVLIALNTGLRKDGVMSLKWSEVDFAQGRITKVVKGDKKVHIPMPQVLKEALLTARQEKVLSQYVLPSDRNHGQAFKDLKKSFSHALGRARINDFRFHDLSIPSPQTSSEGRRI